MIMIGLFLLLGALILFILLLLLLEMIAWFYRGKSPRRVSTRIDSSPNLNLSFHELVAILVTIGLPLFIEENQNPFLI